MKPSILYVKLNSLENSHLVLTFYLGNVKRACIKPVIHIFNYFCGNKYGSFEVQAICHLGVLKIRSHLVLHSAWDEAKCWQSDCLKPRRRHGFHQACTMARLLFRWLDSMGRGLKAQWKGWGGVWQRWKARRYWLGLLDLKKRDRERIWRRRRERESILTPTMKA